MRLLFPDERMVCRYFILILALYIGVMSFLFPMQGDDFAFAWQLRDNGMFATVKEIYFSWTLRLGEIFNMLLLYGGKNCFNFINPLLQLALPAAAFFFAFGGKFDWKSKAGGLALALLFAMTAVFLARPRDTVFWMTGANVYAFGLALWFGFWGYVFRCGKVAGAEKRSPVLCIGGMLWGVAAALTLENATLCGIVVGAAIPVWARRQRRRLSCREKFALAGYALGVVVFFTQPGRWCRLQSFRTVPNGLWAMAGLAKEVGLFYLVSACFAFGLLGLSAVLLYRLDRERLKRELPQAAGLLLLSGVAAGCFIAAQIAPAMRAYLLSALLVALAAIRLFVALYESGKTGRKLCVRLALCVMAGALFQAGRALPDFRRIHREQFLREKLLAAKPQTECRVPAHSTVRREFFQYIWIEDFSDDPQNPFNIHAARYYGVPALRTERNQAVRIYWKKQ